MASMKLRRQLGRRVRAAPVLHGADLRATDVGVGIAGRPLGRVGLEPLDRRLEPVAHPPRLVRQAAELARDLRVLLLVRDGAELTGMQVADARDVIVEIARRRLDLVDLRAQLRARRGRRTCSKKALGSRRSPPAPPMGPLTGPEPYCGPASYAWPPAGREGRPPEAAVRC